ncbi:MAG TPA: hypothetical protein VJB96_00110 [Patescibacteria group bacterium]|nr:hypothetical protein [Patescibacteria group bacterium]
MRKKKAFSAQNITSSIARKSMLTTNLADVYANPIFQTQMQGSFYRALMRSKKYSLLRILFAMIFFILPSIACAIFFISIFIIGNTPLEEAAFMLIPVLLFIFLYLLTGIRLLFPSKIN